MNRNGLLFFKTRGCLWTLGIRPRPMARRMALAILRWFLGRRPVSRECLMRPVSVMYSDVMVKFCIVVSHDTRLDTVTAWSAAGLHLVLEQRVDAKHVKGILGRPPTPILPFLLLGARQVMRSVNVTRSPLAVDLALVQAAALRLDHLTRLVGAVEAGFAREAGRRAGGGEGSGTGRGGAAADDGNQGVV